MTAVRTANSMESAERRRDIAREALVRAGLTPVPAPAGATIHRDDGTRDANRARFAYVTHLHNGRKIAINVRHVLSVVEWDALNGDWTTVVILTHGDPIRVQGSVEDVTAQLEGATA